MKTKIYIFVVLAGWHFSSLYAGNTPAVPSQAELPASNTEALDEYVEIDEDGEEVDVLHSTLILPRLPQLASSLEKSIDFLEGVDFSVISEEVSPVPEAPEEVLAPKQESLPPLVPEPKLTFSPVPVVVEISQAESPPPAPRPLVPPSAVACDSFLQHSDVCAALKWGCHEAYNRDRYEEALAKAQAMDPQRAADWVALLLRVLAEKRLHRYLDTLTYTPYTPPANIPMNAAQLAAISFIHTRQGQQNIRVQTLLSTVILALQTLAAAPNTVSQWGPLLEKELVEENLPRFFSRKYALLAHVLGAIQRVPSACPLAMEAYGKIEGLPDARLQLFSHLFFFLTGKPPIAHPENTLKLMMKKGAIDPKNNETGLDFIQLAEVFGNVEIAGMLRSL